MEDITELINSVLPDDVTKIDRYNAEFESTNLYTINPTNIDDSTSFKFIDDKYIVRANSINYLNKLTTIKFIQDTPLEAFNIGYKHRANLESITSTITERLIKSSGFLLNESWVSQEIFYSRVIKLTEDSIYCELILDKSERKTELRSFPKILFEHLPQINENYPLMIKINLKPGTFKIEIIDGKGFNVESEFDSLLDWSGIEEFKNDL